MTNLLSPLPLQVGLIAVSPFGIEGTCLITGEGVYETPWAVV